MFARTARLTLRPAWSEDAPALARAIAHESVVMFLARVPWPYTEADALDWIERRDDKDMFLSIFAHEGAAQPRLIGGIGIHPADDLGGHEIGYWLTPDSWGRGYATEAGQATIEIARYALGLRHLRSRHWVDNPASGNVLRKLGFRPTGHCRTFSVARQVEVDCVTLERDLDDDRMGAHMQLAA